MTQLPKVVRGEGPTNPKLIIIGEAPGEQEDLTGRPFFPEAPAGKLLMRIINSVGLQREDVYLDNVIPIRPPDNKIKRLAEWGMSPETFYPDLKDRLDKINCNIIMACGEVALNALTPEHGITKHRGSVYQIDKRLIIPTFHPSFINREAWKMLGVTINDFQKAVRISKEGYQAPIFSTKINPTFQEVTRFLEDVREAPRFSFDIEVVGGGQIACIGIAIDNGGKTNPYDQQSVNRISGQPLESNLPILSAMSIPFKKGFSNYFSYDEEQWIWHLLASVFQGPQLKIGQNLNYDLTKLLPFIGEPSPPWFDLMMAHHLIEPDLPHTLAFQTSLYTYPPVNYYKDDPKDEEKDWKKMTSSERLWEYNCKDVIVPMMIEPVYRQELSRLNMLNFFEGFMMPKTRCLWRLQQRGLLLDEEKRQELLSHQTTQLTEMQKLLNESVGYPLNPASNKQMVKFLYEDLKLPKQFDRKTKQPTANKQALEKLQAFHPHPALNLAVDIRKLAHDISTYLMVEPEPDGRVKGRYNAAGAATGRSSSKKNYDGRGLDLHNIPEVDRKMFKAPEGKCLIVRDLWQAEALIVANLSDCKPFLDRLSKGQKLHRLVASWCFNKPESDIDNNNRPGGEYYTGKRVGHGLNYGLGPILLAITLKCPISLAKYYRERYFTEAREIEQWHLDIQQELKATRRLITPLGRLRQFRDRMGEDLFRKAYAHVPQSVIAELNHLALIKLDYMLPPDCEVIQEGYDAVVIESDKAKTEKVKAILNLIDSKKVFIRGRVVNVPGETSIMERWMK